MPVVKRRADAPGHKGKIDLYVTLNLVHLIPKDCICVQYQMGTANFRFVSSYVVYLKVPTNIYRLVSVKGRLLAWRGPAPEKPSDHNVPR